MSQEVEMLLVSTATSPAAVPCQRRSAIELGTEEFLRLLSFHHGGHDTMWPISVA